jgi:DNA-binding IclR family transcriptional regulator
VEELVKCCNETASVGVFRGGKVIYIDVAETTESVRVVSRLGAVLPAYCTSIGKVLLASRPQEEVLDYLKATPMIAFTDKTLSDQEALNHQFCQIRRQGYAVDNEEYEHSVKCIAVPIRDHTTAVVAGLSISGPAHRLQDSRIAKELLPALLEAGQELSKRLGYNSKFSEDRVH